MNSPPDPGSPVLSTPSSGSPPPEDITFQQNVTDQDPSLISGGGFKRRFPSGASFGPSSSSRDTKSRRRGEPGRGSDARNWPEGGKELAGMKKEKDELLDQSLVDYLRKEIGDPFL